ncbi:MAG: hypothetical protein NVS9B3_06030 [Gemmatimonadaceae bacterium]
MRTTLLHFSALAALACSSAPRPTDTPAAVRPVPITGGFVVRLGNDTVSLERYTRTVSRLEGEMVVRAPRTRVGHYAADLTSAGTVSRFEFELHPIVPDARSPRSQGATLVFARDSVTVHNRINDSTTTRRLAVTRATYPYLSGSIGVSELLTVRARSSRGDTTDVAIVPAGAAQLFPMRLIRVGADSLTIALGLSPTPARARVDAQGRILGQQALASTQKFTVERVAPMNIDSMARLFSSREIGTLSPTDGTVGGVLLSVVDSRPAQPRRAIFGSVVPVGEPRRRGERD